MRTIRRIHRLTASFLSVALLLVAISGILLHRPLAAGLYGHRDMAPLPVTE